MTATEYASVLGGTGNVSKSAFINMMEQRGIYVIEDGENPQDLTPGFATHLAYQGLVFWYDSADALTAHDGVTCIVTADGKRFKSDGFEGAQARFFKIVDKDLTAPPGSPTLGDSYIVATGGSGAWATHDGHVASYTARGWLFTAPNAYDLAAVVDETTIYHRSVGGSWVSGFPFFTIGANTVLPSALKYGRFGHACVNQTTDAPPGSPADGDTYIIGASPTGAWSGHARKVAIYESSAWVIYTPYEGALLFDRSNDTFYFYDGSAWVSLSSGYSQVTDAFTAAAATMTASGIVGTANDYAYSATTAPTTSSPNSTDAVTITHTAKAAGKILELEYDATLETAPITSTVAVIAAVQVDSGATMADWCGLGLWSAGKLHFKFRLTASDALAHTYAIKFFYNVNANATPAPVLSRRHLLLRERA